MSKKPPLELTGDFLKDSFDLAKLAGNIGDTLFQIAKSFRRLGQHDLADELTDLSNDCEFVDEAIRKIAGNETSRGLHEAQNMSANILKSCLAGMKVSKEKICAE